jgi:hypothetical protein
MAPLNALTFCLAENSNGMHLMLASVSNTLSLELEDVLFKERIVLAQVLSILVNSTLKELNQHHSSKFSKYLLV